MNIITKCSETVEHATSETYFFLRTTSSRSHILIVTQIDDTKVSLYPVCPTVLRTKPLPSTCSSTRSGDSRCKVYDFRTCGSHLTSGRQHCCSCLNLSRSFPYSLVHTQPFPHTYANGLCLRAPFIYLRAASGTQEGFPLLCLLACARPYSQFVNLVIVLRKTWNREEGTVRQRDF